MKIKLSQNRIIEIKAKWLVWGFVTVFVVLPLLPPLGSAILTAIDEAICNQDRLCRNMRENAREMKALREEAERLSRDQDEMHKQQNR